MDVPLQKWPGQSVFPATDPSERMYSHRTPVEVGEEKEVSSLLVFIRFRKRPVRHSGFRNQGPHGRKIALAARSYMNILSGTVKVQKL